MACPCAHSVLKAPAGSITAPTCELVPQERAQDFGAIDSPARVYAWLSPRSVHLKHERAWMLLLSPAKALRVQSELARGTSDEVVIDLDWALSCARTPEHTPYAILAHNHPNGSAWPSMADARLTAEMGAAADRQGFELLDHVVLGKGEVFSFHLRRLLSV